MEDLQKQITNENNQQVINNERKTDIQQEDTSLLQEGEMQSENTLQEQEEDTLQMKEENENENETNIKQSEMEDRNDNFQQENVEKIVEPETVSEQTPVSVEETVSEQALAEEIVSEQALAEETVSEQVSEEETVSEQVLAEETVSEQALAEEIKESPAEIYQEKAKEELQEKLAMGEETLSEEIDIADDFFDHLNRQEIVETIEETVGETDIIKIKKQMSLLKIRFLKLTKEDREERLQSFLTNGGNKEDFDSSPDELDMRFNEAFDHYKANKAKYMEDMEQIKIANVKKKQALLEELKQLIESSTDSLKQIYDRFREIQVTWKEIGAVPQGNVRELWQNYHFYVEKFFDKVKINRELRDLDLKKNMERKLEICEKTEALLFETSIVRSFKLLQQYHQEWKEAGPVEDDKREELWNRFKTASDKINQSRRDYYDQLYKLQSDNYNAKLVICEQIEELANTEITSFKQLNKMSSQVMELFKSWETIGTVHKDVYDAIWERLRKACDIFFANKKQYLARIKEEQVENYNLKLNLCMEAEALASRNDWKKATAEIIALQGEWKKIGTHSRHQSEALWNRFRKACNLFFQLKTEYFLDVQKHEADNLQKKEDLIKRVNEYVFVDSREENFEVLKAFQREWTAIGYIALSEKERLTNAFREAINKRFDELKISAQEVNKAKYKEHISGMMTKGSKSNGNGFLEKEQRFLQNKIKQLTDDVNLWENNLGFFAHSKNSDELKAQFNKKIEQAKQEITTLKTKLSILQKEKKK
ncbi:MAG: DUF349 domain-containing protein [Bacteroidales bacterium]|jgi:hypothetical protein|nr:DUF349 domain-containing protein [Bacteroidales bacterium]